MQQNNCDVIITYSWNRVGYNILRSLSSYGLKVWCADTSKKNICSLSKYCYGSFTYPDPFKDEEAFIKILLDKIKELNPKVLLPTHDESVVIMRNRNKFPNELIIPYESDKKLLSLANKAIATKLAEEAGVPIPKVYKNINDINSYPVVFKTVIGNSAKGVYFPQNNNELQNLIDKYKNEKTLIQEWIGGCDYSVDCVRWDNFYKSSTYHALVTKTNGGGTTTQREIVNMPELEKYAKMLLDYVDFKGVCGLDFRYDEKTKRVAFIEINARFTGGIATPIAAGFNIPLVIYKLSIEGKYNEEITIKTGTKTKWILGDIITLVGRIISFKLSFAEIKQVFSFNGFNAFDDFYTDDPKAFIGEIKYYLEKLIKNKKLNP